NAYTEAARRAAEFIWEELRGDGGRLLKRWRQGHSGLPGHLDDYAYLIWGLLELYEATFSPLHLERASGLAGRMIELFWDEEEGGFFFTASGELLVRKKEFYDGAMPSGNSVAALTLMRLGRLLARPEWEEKGYRVLEAHGAQLERSPGAFTALLAALSFSAAGGQEITVAGRPGYADTTAMLDALRTPFLPNAVVAFRPEPEDTSDITRLAPYTEAQRAQYGRATAYVCRDQACEQPVTDPDRMLEQIEGLAT
ncbi:MAG: thioredoxin domain-containing protein, partial [bacterium]